MITDTGSSSVWNPWSLTLHDKGLCGLVRPAGVHHNPIRLFDCPRFIEKETDESISV